MTALQRSVTDYHQTLLFIYGCTGPTTPIIGYAQGFYCLTLIIGVNRSTDNVTPQSQLRYEVFANGQFI